MGSFFRVVLAQLESFKFECSGVFGAGFLFHFLKLIPVHDASVDVVVVADGVCNFSKSRHLSSSEPGRLVLFRVPFDFVRKPTLYILAAHGVRMKGQMLDNVILQFAHERDSAFVVFSHSVVPAQWGCRLLTLNQEVQVRVSKNAVCICCPLDAFMVLLFRRRDHLADGFVPLQLSGMLADKVNVGRVSEDIERIFHGLVHAVCEPWSVMLSFEKVQRLERIVYSINVLLFGTGRCVSSVLVGRNIFFLTLTPANERGQFLQELFHMFFRPFVNLVRIHSPFSQWLKFFSLLKLVFGK